jgi:hypothetical protein
VENLLAALSDMCGGVRCHAIQALGIIGDARAIEPLCTQLRDKNPDVRVAAFHALALFGAQAVIPLCRLLQAPKERESRAARKALVLMLDLKTPEVHFHILSDAEIQVSERCRYLEILLGFYTEPFTLFPFRRSKPYLAGVSHFCEYALQFPTAEPEIIAGARAVLDYLSLGRPSQRALTADSGILLRPSQESAPTGGADILLRASQSEDEPPPPQTLLERLKRWFGRE